MSNHGEEGLKAHPSLQQWLKILGFIEVLDAIAANEETLDFVVCPDEMGLYGVIDLRVRRGGDQDGLLELVLANFHFHCLQYC